MWGGSDLLTFAHGRCWWAISIIQGPKMSEFTDSSDVLAAQKSPRTTVKHPKDRKHAPETTVRAGSPRYGRGMVVMAAPLFPLLALARKSRGVAREGG